MMPAAHEATERGVDLPRHAFRVGWAAEKVALRLETDPLPRYGIQNDTWPPVLTGTGGAS